MWFAGNAIHSANADMAAIATYEEAFNKISVVTQKKDLTSIVEDFIIVEDQNFALFNYVNELNGEVCKLTPASTLCAYPSVRSLLIRMGKSCYGPFDWLID